MMTQNPYEPSVQGDVLIQLKESSIDYRLLQRRSSWALMFLQMAIVSEVLCIAGLLVHLCMLTQMMRGEVYGDSEVELAELAYNGLVFLWGVIFLISAVMVLRWMRTAYRNLAVLGWTHCETTVGWLTAYWFLPIANLYKPYQIMLELADKSRHSPLLGSMPALIDPQPLPVGFWWAGWIVGPAVIRIADKLIDKAEGGQAIATAMVIGVVGNVCLLSAAVLLSKIIREITARQQQSFATIKS